MIAIIALFCAGISIGMMIAAGVAVINKDEVDQKTPLFLRPTICAECNVISFDDGVVALPIRGLCKRCEARNKLAQETQERFNEQGD